MARISVVMVDGVADWEIGVVLPAAREWFGDEVVIASTDGAPVTSIGGLSIHPTQALSSLSPLESELWLLPGSERWQDGAIAALTFALRTRQAAGLATAAICGATLALARAGLLDEQPHTSNSLDFLKQHVPGYRGEQHYRAEHVVSEGLLITAPGTSPVSFACACMRLLHADREDQIVQFRDSFATEFA